MFRSNKSALFSFLLHCILVLFTGILLHNDNGIVAQSSTIVAAFSFHSLYPKAHPPKSYTFHKVPHNNNVLYKPTSTRGKIIRYISSNINRDESKVSKQRNIRTNAVHQYDGQRQNGTVSAKLFDSSFLPSSLPLPLPLVDVPHKEQVKDYYTQKVTLNSDIKSNILETKSKLQASSENLIVWEQQQQQQAGFKNLLPIFAIAAVMAGGMSVSNEYGFTVADAAAIIDRFTVNPQQALSDVVSTVENLGPLGPIFYGIFYTFAELLAIPATPLTMSAGYLFGLFQGVAVVLSAGVTAASISFFIGRTFLRSHVETHILKNNPRLAKIDKAIGEEQNGFKLLLLLRLSPLFPFALSNYVYGASSIDFPSYFMATLLGFIPGTVALIYTGMVGKELTAAVATGDDGTHPIAMYAVGLVAVLTFMKLITDVATNILGAIDDEDEIDETTQP